MTTPLTEEHGFREATLWSTPIRDLGLTISGTRLEPILADFQQELDAAGFERLRPRFYLSTEWGVPFATVAIAIPFYLARQELTAMHAARIGHVEGIDRADILRYLRHEMGHVVNYAYRLYDDPEWARLFGPIHQPYEDDYRPRPFSRKFVRHLPGWYAQKHPDEDWAETFAVWLTPGAEWRAEYEHWPEALAKLDYCDRTVRGLLGRDPSVVDVDLDENVEELDYSVEQFYRDLSGSEQGLAVNLDAALQAVFAGVVSRESDEPPVLRQAAHLIARLEGDLLGNVYRWTGHFPERTRILVQHLARRAAALGLAYPEADEAAVTVALTTLVTALAMNYVHSGTYLA